MAVLGNVVHELLILLGGPEPSPQLLLVAARLLRHAGIACRRQQQAKTPAGRWPRARADRSLTMIARYMEGEM